MKRLASWAIERGGALGLVMLVCYIAVAPHHVVDGDNAEFAALGAVGGGAHPSGYPSYILWLRATAWLPAATPAHAAAIATALLGALGVVVLHAACRVWGARAVAATAATGVFAAAPVVMRYASQAEAFAMNNLVVASVLWLAAAAGPLRGWKRAAALGLVAGLGLADHLTCALVAPVGLLGVVRGVREAGWRAAAAAVVGLALGLTPYLYLFVAPVSAASWRRPESFAELYAIVTRAEYGGAAGFSGLGGQIDVGWQLGTLGETVLRSWLWVLAPLGLAALAVLCVRRPDNADPGEPRAGWIALVASWLVAGPLLVLRFDTPVGDFGLYVVERFHLLPALLLTLPIAVALDRLWRRAVPHALVGAAGATACVVAAVVALVVAAVPALLSARPRALEAGVYNMLRSMPRRAVILGHGDTIDTATRYVQLARGERPDVSYVHWTFLGTGWYRDHIARAGLVLPPGPPSAIPLARQLFAEGRPLFVDQTHEPVGELGRVFKLHPYGFLMRVVPEGTPEPTLADVVRENQALYGKFDLDYPLPSIHQIHAAAMNQRYATTWINLARALAVAGDREEAAHAAAVAQQLAPTPD